MRKFKAKEKKAFSLFKVEIAYIAEIVSSNAQGPYLLPLTDFFNFNFSFSMLPDIISDNTPVPFL